MGALGEALGAYLLYALCSFPSTAERFPKGPHPSLQLLDSGSVNWLRSGNRTHDHDFLLQGLTSAFCSPHLNVSGVYKSSITQAGYALS